MWTDQTAPSLDDFARLAAEAFAELPEPFRSMSLECEIRVEDYADEETLDGLEMEDPLDLTGLYHGFHVGERDQMGPAAEPSRIFLYRMPILFEWSTRGDVGLKTLIAHVLIHEIGHHFGLTDDRIDEIEDED